MMKRGKWTLLALVVLLWGANWPVLKLAVAASSPLWFAALRLGMGAVLLFAAVPASGGHIALPRRREWPIILSVGLLQMAAFMAFINLGLMHVDAGRSAVLAYTTPLWVAPGAVLLLGERMTWRKATGLLLGLLGVGVMFGPAHFDWSDSQAVTGNAMLLAAAFVWALAILHVRGHEWEVRPLDLAPWQMLVGLVPVALLAAFIEGPPRFALTWPMAAIIFYNGPLATALGFWGAVTVTRALPAITTSLSFLAVPVVGFALSWAWLGEQLAADTLLGFLLIIAGVAVVTFFAGAQDQHAL